MRGVQVQALAFGYTNGRRQMVPRGNTATTNDRGEFRLFWLEPGTYYVVANPTPPPDVLRMQAGPLRVGYIPSDPDATFVTTYFPGSSDIRKAEPIQVEFGELDLHAIQVAALPSRLIRMRIVNPKLVENNNYVPLATLHPLMDLSATSYSNLPRPLGNGEFEFRTGLIPGQYRLLVVVLSPGGTHVGSAKLTVDREDPDIVEIPVSQTISVQGQVLMEGAASSLKIMCVPEPSHTSGFPISSDVRPNGKFLLEDILPGAYTVSVDGLENDAYLASVQLQGEEVSSGSVEFPPDVASLSLTLSIKKDGGSISGIAVDERRTAQAGAVVVLVPNIEFRTRLDRFRFAVTNNQGEFQIRSIAPGNYSVLAFEQMESEALTDPAFLKRFEASGRPLTISGGNRLNFGSIQILKQ